MDIGKMDIRDLKALAYDEISKLELAQKNLAVINQAIAQKGAQNEKGTTVEPARDLREPEGKTETGTEPVTEDVTG